MNYLIYRLQFNIRSYDNIQICGWQSECSADAGGSVRNVRGGLSGIDSVAYILFDCTKFNRLRQDILWQGTSTRNMTKILDTPNLAKRAANFMARTGLFGELGMACLADAKQNPQQTEENLDAGLEP